MTTKRRSLKALFFALVITGLCSLPVWYLGHLHQRTLLEDLGSQYRSTPFAYALTNKPGVFTHVDAEQQVSLILYYDAARCLAEEAACKPLLEEQDKVMHFLEQELTPVDKSAGKGKPVRTVAMVRGETPKELSSHWDVVSLAADETLPFPETLKADAPAAFVVLDDDGFIRSYLTAATEQRLPKAVTILRKVASQQNLMDYLTQQTLMWEKAKRIARGVEEDPQT
jgi:hypothetical protein